MEEDFFRLMSPKLTALVTTISEKGREDVATFSWITPVSFNPPMLAISIGPDKHSYWNITRVNEFIVNIPKEEQLNQIWQAGKKWDKEKSNIEKAGLKTRPADKVKPPLLPECAASLECMVETTKKAGDHVIVIGKVVKTHADEELLDDNGNLKVDVARPPLHVADNLFAFPYVTKSV